MKTFLISWFLFASTITVAYCQSVSYSRVRIYADEMQILKLESSGIPVDHGMIKKGMWIETDLSTEEIKKVNSLGVMTEILIADVVSFYQSREDNRGGERNASCYDAIDYPVPSGFSLGSMGGFFTYQEMLDHLDSMSARYPDLITSKQVVSDTTSIEGRPLWYLKISDNPSTDESEPEMLYTAVHHAREPASLSQLIFYMYYLLENYSKDSTVKYLVDHTEMYFIPCINPDGYIYNHTSQPSGGGMWRKNRRDNQDGSYGVDLNRNYGFTWGYDNTGSSGNSSSDTYRGTAAFSEPELQAVREFTINHEFRLAVNYHTYGNLLIYPWGYKLGELTPDSSTFSSFAKFMTEENSFKYGTGDQTVGYVTNGDSDDWMYGDSITKPKIFSMTPEAGDQSDGFWPAQGRIIDICKSNIRQNLNAALVVNPYLRVRDLSSLWMGDSAFVKFNFEAAGLDASGFSVEILSDAFTASSVWSANLVHLDQGIDSVQIIKNSSFTGTSFDIIYKISNGVYTYYDTIGKFYGQQQNIAQDDFSGGTSILTGGSWGMDNSRYQSSSYSFSDSPGVNYAAGENNLVVMDLDLTSEINSLLRFYASWDIEKGYDYAQVLVSVDNGSSWVPQCGQYTVRGSDYQDLDNPVYDGVQNTWVLEEINLSEYSGLNIQIGFKLVSDQFVEGEGFFIDDLQVISLPQVITDLKSKESVSMYFSSKENRIYLKGYPENSRYVIYNMLGMELKHGAVSGRYIETSRLSKGGYVIKVNQGSLHGVLRFAVIE